MKRFNAFDNQNDTKKQKLNDDYEDLWGEDPNIDDIDDCLILATQVIENKETSLHRNNISIFPSYNAFKVRDVPASTQIASTSFAQPAPPAQTLQDRLKNLQAELEAKEGEVTVLRTQLKESRSAAVAENAKKQEEFNKQLVATRKEMRVHTTELEFKNLEITNLKLKLMNLSKVMKPDTNLTCTQIGQLLESPDEATNKNQMEPLKLKPILYEVYPLQSKDASEIFAMPTAENNTCDSLDVSLIDRTHKMQSSTVIENLIKLKSHSKFVDGKILSLEYVFSEISTLMRQNAVELNSKANHDYINKILIVSLQFLYDLNGYLSDLKAMLQKETIRQMDLSYLNDSSHGDEGCPVIYSSRCWCPNESGIQLRQLVAFSSRILAFSNHMCDYLIHNKSVFKANENFNIESKNNYTYLSLVLSVVTLIGQTRKGFNYCGLLAAICLLISQIAASKELPSQICDFMSGILKEIVLSRPSNLVMPYLYVALKKCALHPPFVEKLCSMPHENFLKENTKKGITFINDSCCIFQTFALLCRDNLKRARRVDLKLHLDVLTFICNIFNSNAKWLYYHENQHFDCLYQSNKLSVEIIYLMLDIIDKEQIVSSDAVKTSIKLLNVINFKSYEFLERHIAIYSQYQILLRRLSSLNLPEFYREDLEKLIKISIEDEPSVEDKFNEIHLWN